jgi:hypothetical protein
VIKNGEGPTALLTGGNHGDEYEGPIALFDLARTLKAGDVSGRVIIVPAMNYPAFVAGTRTSPIDKGNMNRSFPGRPDGTVTQKIADYFQRELLPLADVVLDFHSGGKTLDFLPFCAGHTLPDKEQEPLLRTCRCVFGALFDEDARDRCRRHVRHGGRGDGQDLHSPPNSAAAERQLQRAPELPSAALSTYCVRRELLQESPILSARNGWTCQAEIAFPLPRRLA